MAKSIWDEAFTEPRLGVCPAARLNKQTGVWVVAGPGNFPVKDHDEIISSPCAGSSVAVHLRSKKLEKDTGL